MQRGELFSIFYVVYIFCGIWSCRYCVNFFISFQYRVYCIQPPTNFHRCRLEPFIQGNRLGCTYMPFNQSGPTSVLGNVWFNENDILTIFNWISYIYSQIKLSAKPNHNPVCIKKSHVGFISTIIWLLLKSWPHTSTVLPFSRTLSDICMKHKVLINVMEDKK